jgi:hypothetical protein
MIRSLKLSDRNRNKRTLFDLKFKIIHGITKKIEEARNKFHEYIYQGRELLISTLSS